MTLKDAINDVDNLSALAKVHQREEEEEEEEEETLLSVQAFENKDEVALLPQELLIQSIDTSVVIRQLPSQGLSFQLWPAASSLVSFIECCSSSSSPIFPFSQPNGKRISILELGSGTGLVGIAAASLLHSHVTITDQPHVLPNLQFNADANNAATISNGGSVDVHCLRWGNVDDMASLGHCFDLLLASDVVYHSHLFDILLQTLSFFIQGHTALVMAHLRRWKKDGVFFKKARKLFNVSMLHTDQPLPGSRTGVTIYLFTPKHQDNNK